MKIKLNVKVNLTTKGRLFTIWPKSHKFLPGLEFYTGHGSSTSEAIEDLYAQLPEEFTIDDEFVVRTASLEHSLQRPFQIMHSDTVRDFVLR